VAVRDPRGVVAERLRELHLPDDGGDGLGAEDPDVELHGRRPRGPGIVGDQRSARPSGLNARRNSSWDMPARSTSTRLSWKTAPRPMSESFSITVTVMLAPPGLSLGQCPLLPLARPGDTRSLISTRARYSPRSLNTRAIAPFVRPRAAASSAWSSTRCGPSLSRMAGRFENSGLRKGGPAGPPGGGGEARGGAGSPRARR